RPLIIIKIQSASWQAAIVRALAGMLVSLTEGSSNTFIWNFHIIGVATANKIILNQRMGFGTRFSAAAMTSKPPVMTVRINPIHITGNNRRKGFNGMLVAKPSMRAQTMALVAMMKQ